MTILAPVTLFGWAPLSVIFFWIFNGRVAVLLTTIGGVLFLPMVSYNLPGLPGYSKITATALGLLLGSFLTGQKKKYPYSWTKYDIFMISWCFIAPVASSLSNGLGLYDGISGAVDTYLTWGIFFWVGRMYFSDFESLKKLGYALIIGGLLYVPLCFFEVRMSPQLSNIFYGIFPHSFSQHIRYGGYRPIVFMQHGLMVALWMALTTTVAYWLWRAKELKSIGPISLSFYLILMVITVIVCKSTNGYFFLLFGLISYSLYAGKSSVFVFKLTIYFIFLYILVRAFAIIDSEFVRSIAEKFVNPERAVSLSARLLQEDLFCAKALLKPFFGWGGWSRGWPINPETGQVLKAVDSTWVISFSERGFFGLLALYCSMLLPPYLYFSEWKNRHIFFKNLDKSTEIYLISLCLVIIFYMIDSLMNGMINPVYTLCAGALLSNYINGKN